jgi:hypothetical protein
VNSDQADIQRIRDEIRVSRRMTDLERLQWLEEICVFTNMFRQAPEVPRSEPATLAPGKSATDSAA